MICTKNLSPVLMCGLGAAFIASDATAGAMSISPLMLSITQTNKSEILKVSNPGSEPIRARVSAFAWQQKPTGELQLAPTGDVLFFPAMITVPPGKTAKVRVGVNVPVDNVEKTYRVFLDELPPNSSSATDGTGVRVLTRMGVPVFVQSGKPSPKPRFDGMALRGDKFVFSLRNDGNSHFLAKSVQLTVRTKSGQTSSTHNLPGWYVLAGGERTYESPIARNECTIAQEMVLAAETEQEKLTATYANDTARCGM